MSRVPLTLEVNGRMVRLEVSSRATLADVLREDCALTSVHVGCGQGICGACNVLADGVTRRSCTTLAVSAQGLRIETLEHLSDRNDPIIAALQAAFLAHGGLQCGFCTPGMLLAAREVLSEGGAIDRGNIREALAGNLCRCTGYGPIIDAVAAAAAELP